MRSSHSPAPRPLKSRHAERSEASLFGTGSFGIRLQGGFTLIEMSIVLVIIGLIIGGILVGRDLIKASETRAQIAQIEKYNSAVNTFHNKYGGIPGDLSVNLANQFGFTLGTSCNGQNVAARDGGGLLYGQVTVPENQLSGETTLFWEDLSTANMIDGTFPNSGAPFVGCSAPTAALSNTLGTTYLGDYFPIAKIGYGNYLYVYSGNGNNWYGLSAATNTDTGGDLFTKATIPVIQAYNIDKKMDDGLPTSGSVVAVYVNGSAIPNAPNGPTDTSSTCYSGSTGSYAYSLSATANQGAGLNCALSFRFQ